MKVKQLLAAVGLVTSLWGQTTIIGTVRDARDGYPLPGANVVLSGGSLTTPTGAATDVDGNYLIPNIRPGTYRLQVMYIGYRAVEQSVSITNATGPELALHVVLEFEAIELNVTVVTASRGRREKLTDAPAAISVITAAEIRKGSNPNLGDYFKHVKGVDFTASGIDGFNLSARGFNTSFSSRLLTLTDGRKANVPSLRLIAYNTIPTTSNDVDQIEVVLGPSSALYGPNAFAGVVNIITKKPSLSTGTNLELSLGNQDYRKWQLRYADARGKLGYKVSLVGFHARDWRWVDPEEVKEHNPLWQKYGEEIEDGEYPNAEAPWDWKWDGYNLRFDRDGDGDFSGAEDTVALGTHDRNGDGIPDTASFDVDNNRLDIRVDYDLGPNHTLIYSYGRARATNINITGVARFLADDWIYQYHQLRYVNGNLFIQTYLNSSDAGRTINLRTGDRIFDRSTFYHLQAQHTLDLPQLLESQLSYGFDYQRTMPKTFGTILPDGTKDKYNPKSYDNDGIDNDGDGKVDEYAEGLIITNEYGFYFQSTSKLTRTLELILASRMDLHSGVRDEEHGIKFLADPLLGGSIRYLPQWSPKVGLMWKPVENQTFRFTVARAFNTPSSQGLYLDMLVGLVTPFYVMARGNAFGYHYSRNDDGQLMMYDVRPLTETEFMLAEVPEGAVIYIPPVLGRPYQFIQPADLQDLDPVTSEQLYTVETGYVGILGNRMRFTLDLYYSWYQEFVSDLTWITPVVLDTSKGLSDAVVLGVIGTEEHNGVDPGPDGKYGTDDDTRDFENPMQLLLTNVNYGEVSLGGLDMSLVYFVSPRLSGEVRFSYLGKQAFHNPLTRADDPVNAPGYKISLGTKYSSRSNRLWLGLAARHIPTFDWSAGVFFGTIESYTVLDLNMGYNINDMVTLKGNINNLNGDVHREIVGGAALGRQIVVSLAAKM